MRAGSTEKKIEALLKELTLEEKARLVHASEYFRSGDVPRLGIPKITMSDGPMGVRNDFYPADWHPVGTTADAVSYLPCNSAIAATWNKELARTSGSVLGREARGRGKDMILAPGINIKRNPLCGRNFEYMSEDPCLIAEMVVPLIEGIQENDVSACVKHFACNAQEWERLWVNVELDERTLREIYLPGFEAAVRRAKTYGLMGSYNLVRGEHGSQSRFLLTKILREEWGYDGLVVSDWGAVHDTRAAAESGLDIEMGVTPDFDDYFLGRPLIEAVRKGEIAEAEVDKKVRHILRFMLRVRLIEIVQKEQKNGKGKMVAVPVADRDPGYYNGDIMHRYAKETAREAVILLKNEKHRLPVRPSQTRKLLVIGENANHLHANGGGSGEIKALYEVTPLMGLAREYGGNTEVKYVPGYYVPARLATDASWQEDSTAELMTDTKRRDGRKYDAREKALIKKYRDEAVALAKEYDDVVIVGGLNHDYDVEGMDRKDLSLPYGQDELIKAVLAVNPRAVVVMMAGSPVDMRAWKDDAQAILWMAYNGMEGGTALAEVISGTVNPSGKLPESLPAEFAQTPAAVCGDYPGRKLRAAEKKVMNAHLTQTFKEGVFVGYRYYEKFGVPLQFPFGHGLSYTEYKYSGLKVSKAPGALFEVQVKVKNTGHVSGKEAVQLYVGEKTVSEENPVKELKAFDKVELQPGEEKTLSFTLTERDFSHYCNEENCWKRMKGRMVIYVGASSADVRLKKEVTLS
ncbi:MAG: glycoside hydrolase family 3 C-terminal domain-containing protein [Lachnospiraceae bacterium]|nr:glycoside hydrolase family 3 C-terminal domain-containing protein [Lachnospiraceae bacterium]